MSTPLPTPRDARQLHRLRSLRVQRARETCAQAQQAVADAAEAVAERQRRIESHRRQIDALSEAVVHALAPQLPRWSGMVIAQRERLADLLERDEYALISDEQKLEEAQEALQRARSDLTRALAREDATDGLVRQVRRHLLRERERRADLELEDASPRSLHPAGHA